MKTLQEKYNAVLEGKYPKSQFVRSAKMEVPRFISPYNGFDDTVQILKNKGMLVEQEQVVPEYDKPGPGVSLEALERGIDYELEEMGINTATESPSEEDYEKAKAKVEKNLEKDQRTIYILVLILLQVQEKMELLCITVLKKKIAEQ